MNQSEVRRYLNVIKRAVNLIESMLDNDDGGLLESLVKEVHVPEINVKPEVTSQIPQVSEALDAKPDEPVNSEIQKARNKHIQDLNSIDCWPEAVPQFLVARDASKEDQINRANAVLDMMLDKPLDNLSFLDFGCGDGWIAQEAKNRGVMSSTGFDINSSDNWKNINGVNFFHDVHQVANSSYDVIMLYDVLDHCLDPIQIMSQVRSLLKKDGVVYVRCHPWLSKHATHLYKQGINKAYFHLFLNFEEIQKLINQNPTFTRNEKDPIGAYRWWFKDFEVNKERFIKEPVSEFFYVQSFKELLANEQQIPLDQIDAFLKLMEIQFIDYKLLWKAR